MTRILTLLAALLLALPALAQSRHALVIGIDSYAQVPDLQKARNDAQSVASALQEAGFRTDLVLDADQMALLSALGTFANRLDPGDEAVFYFAGHGVEIDGRNFLLPSDVPRLQPGGELLVTARGLAVDTVLDTLRARGVRVALLILDACRDNPFPRDGTRSLGGTRGLARVAAPEGTFILFSAGYGEAALDRLSDDDPDPNSVFTRILLPRLTEPGLPLHDLSRQVRTEVRSLARSVNHNQFPAVYDQFDGNLVLVPAAAGASAPVPDIAPVTDPCAAALPVWSAIQSSNSLPALEGFVASYQASCPALAALARDRIASLTPPVVAAAPAAVPPAVPPTVPPSASSPNPCVDARDTWNSLSSSTNRGAIERFIATYSASCGALANLARERLAGLERGADQPCNGSSARWGTILNTRSTAALQAFIRDFPACPETAAARNRLSLVEQQITERALRLTQRELNHIRMVLAQSSGRSSDPAHRSVNAADWLDLVERQHLATFTRERLGAGSVLRHLTPAAAERLLAEPLRPRPVALTGLSEMQTTRDWSSYRDAGRCRIASAALSVSDDLIVQIPMFTAAVTPDVSGNSMTWSFLEPMPFDPDRPAHAMIDGRRFELNIDQGRWLKPPFLRNSENLNWAVTRAMRRGSVMTIHGTSSFTGQAMVVEFSLQGFTAAFNRMADMCNRRAVLSWIQ